MKLAQALLQRADLQKRLLQLFERLKRSATVQEGDTPAENPATLLSQLEQDAWALEHLIERINRTNCVSRVAGNGQRIVEAIARRDVLKRLYGIYAGLAEASTVRNAAYTKSEIRFRATMDAADLQKRADDVAREYRELDGRLQEANWAVDLID